MRGGELPLFGEDAWRPFPRILIEMEEGPKETKRARVRNATSRIQSFKCCPTQDLPMSEFPSVLFFLPIGRDNLPNTSGSANLASLDMSLSVQALTQPLKAPQH